MKTLQSIWLGHGASGGPETMQVYIAGLKKLGFDAHALTLPKGSAERAVPALLEQVGNALPDAIIGGHSFGGRVASMVAAEHGCRGLVLLSYPLHRPGHPEDLRTAHWKKITAPILFLSGDRDQFAKIELFLRETARLRNAEAHIYPGARHGLQKDAADVCARIGDFATRVGAATD